MSKPKTVPLEVANPRWANEERTAVNVDVRWSHWVGHPMLDKPLPFTANPADVEGHGRLLFQEIIAGKHGPIADPD